MEASLAVRTWLVWSVLKRVAASRRLLALKTDGRIDANVHSDDQIDSESLHVITV